MGGGAGQLEAWARGRPGANGERIWKKGHEKGTNTWTPGSGGEGLEAWTLGWVSGLGAWTPGSEGGEAGGLNSWVLVREGLEARTPGSGGGRGQRPELRGHRAVSPVGLVVVPQPETVHMVPGGSQRVGRLTFFTVDDSLARLLSFTSMMSLAWVRVEYSGWTNDRMALILCALRPLRRSLPMCTLYSLGEERSCDCGREGREPMTGDRDPGWAMETRGESGSRCHLPHLAVGGGEHPHLVDQHAAAVELAAPEQGHLPGVRALCAWNPVDNPIAFVSV